MTEVHFTAGLHLIKLSVGTESVEDLGRWQARRLRLSGRLFHQTRMMPRRAAELLAGGSIYWVIKGPVQARQRLTAIEPVGDGEGRRSPLLVLDPELSLECLRIPHFYSAFYVYKYATGVSAAIALADKVVNEGETARQAYLNFLKLGGSKFPLEELLDAGVDMRSPEPVEKAIQHFAQLVDQLIELHGHL